MKTFARGWPAQPWRVLGTLALATLAALAFEAMNTPIPWMLGPLVVTAFQVSRLVAVLIIAEPLYRFVVKPRFG